MKKPVQVVHLPTNKPEEWWKHLYVTVSSDVELIKGDWVYSVLYGIGKVTDDNHANYKGETPLLVEYVNRKNYFIPYNTDGTYCNDGKNIYKNDCRNFLNITCKLIKNTFHLSNFI